MVNKVNDDYFKVANTIRESGFRREYLDHLSAVCMKHKREKQVVYSKFAPYTLCSFLDEQPIGDKVYIYFNNDEGERDFKWAIHLLDCKACKFIRPNHAPSESGYFYYISNDSDTIFKIDKCADNELNAVATKISINELMDVMEDSCIMLNESMGDRPYLSRFPEYLDRYNAIIDRRAGMEQ